jgi:hypothetical protein
MAEMYFKIGEGVYPALQCHWLVWSGCGCLAGSVYADYAPSNDEAFRAIFPRREDERFARRRGAFAELVHQGELPDLRRLLRSPCPHREES